LKKKDIKLSKIKMALKLPQGMNEHYGKNIDKLPELLNAGEVPMSAARLMQARLQDGEQFPDLWNNYFDTSDLIVYPKGDNRNVYVLLTVDNKGKITSNGRKALELIRQDNLASNYGAVVEQLEELEELEGEGLIKVPRNKIITETYLTKNKALDEQVWRTLARHPDEVPESFAEDKALLGKYFDGVESRTGKSENMALYIGDSLDDETTLKAWCVYGADRGLRSDADSRGILGSGDGRFVGLAPEALVARNFSGSLLDRLANVEGVDPGDLDEIRRVLNRPVVSAEQILEASGKYVPEVAREAFEKDVRTLYGKDQ